MISNTTRHTQRLSPQRPPEAKRPLWINFFHIYQPPHWDVRIIERVADEAYRPFLHVLKKHPDVKVTLNITGSLTEQLAEHGARDILENLVLLAERGQIEFTGSAKYHTILPLLPKEEIIRQIRLNTEMNRALLGDVFSPRGFFPPELCYSFNMAEAIQEAGYDWILLDEISHSGKVGAASFDKRYSLPKTDLSIVFRNRLLSDYLSFSAPVADSAKTLRTLVRDIRSSRFLITAMDGENLGHHRPGANLLWERTVTQLPTATVSEYLAMLTAVEEVNPLRASWSSREEELAEGVPYLLWQNPRNPIHQLQWPLTQLAIDAVNRAIQVGDARLGDARLALDQALASDQYWWASATPWWSVEIVERGAKTLLGIFRMLTSILPAERKHAEKLASLIIDQAHQWQESGEAARIRDAYLTSGGQVRFLGGEKISK